MIKRDELIDLIRNEHDPKPKDGWAHDRWDDGAEQIADKILAEIADETERCVMLTETRAQIARDAARRMRVLGSYTVRNLWPFLSKSVVVAPRYEQAAREMEEVAKSFDVLAYCIRRGYDTRKPNQEEANANPG